jgi:hypothetical protein
MPDNTDELEKTINEMFAADTECGINSGGRRLSNGAQRSGAAYNCNE